jgi:hypothetical protein
LGTKQLADPPAILSAGPLTTVSIEPADLFRIGVHKTGEPYFQHSGASRFDAPGARKKMPAPEYDSCYFGLTFECAIAESVLHDLVPVDSAFRISPARLASFYLHRFEGQPLLLADLTGAALKKLDGNADLAGHDPEYKKTQKWALAVFENPAKVDGFIYMSRHLNTEKAVILFGHAKPKVIAKRPTKLINVHGFKAAASLFNIVAA